MSSSLFSVHFQSVFCCNSYLMGSVFSETLCESFAMFCISPRNGLSSSGVLGGPIYSVAFFPYLVFPVFIDFISQPGCLLENFLDFLSPALYPGSWTCSVIVSSLFRCFSLSHLLLLICRLTVRVLGN